ncbi:hypothetical protein [Rhodococcoides kyotonense]|uniref:ABC transporter permease n=1 Tax=Rhodococcoides kyotonense TaxID=398843 RepID=A0A239EET3_9NOCA|nr:hypothetical protein [Rhodococcus kyotonensis]SNS42961.1 hypothetical protein SAMN05421642_102337 [Rhodococcus kyotonensis]
MKPTTWPRAVAIALAGAAALAVVVLAFLWPSVTSKVHEIPVAVVGDSPALTSQLSETFDVSTVPDRATAVAQIEAREVYGAVISGPTPEVLTASANGTVVSQVFSGVASKLGTTVTDIVPLASTDARGAGLSAMGFPLVIGGIVGGVIISMLVKGAGRRLLATAIYGVGAGIVVAAITQGWFGMLQGAVVPNVAAAGLSVLAVSALIVGLTSIIGPAGIGVAAILMMFIGNQISGAAQPWQFLPRPWGVVGQFFPPGAGATLLRNLSYFPNAATAQSWLVLAAWVAAGVAFMAIGHRRMQASTRSVVRASSVDEPERVAL